MDARRLYGGAAAAGLVAVGLVAVPTSANAATRLPAASGNKPPVVKLTEKNGKIQVSKGKVAPGVIRFSVGKTKESLDVVATKDVNKVLSLFPAVFGPPPQNAVAVKKIRKLATFYGGGPKGTIWDVELGKGTYYVGGSTSYAKFKVKGKPSGVSMHATNASVWAKSASGGDSKWKTNNLDNLGNGWLSFANQSKELHFMELSGVKKSTTNKMVRDYFASGSQQQPPWGTKKQFAFDILSPGVSVAIKGPIAKSKYLLACFMPSETDGTPHALMGMWKLVNVA